MAQHPNVTQLTHWLDGEAIELDDHVDSCELCAQRLDEIGQSDADLRPALLRLLEPPADLENRVAAELSKRLQATQDLELFTSLFGVPADSTKLLFDDEDDHRR